LGVLDEEFFWLFVAELQDHALGNPLLLLVVDESSCLYQFYHKTIVNYMRITSPFTLIFQYIHKTTPAIAESSISISRSEII